MFKMDELGLEKNLDSISDQIIEFNTEGSPLTKQYQPQMDLKVSQSPNKSWQNAYLKQYVSNSYR